MYNNFVATNNGVSQLLDTIISAYKTKTALKMKGQFQMREVYK